MSALTIQQAGKIAQQAGFSGNGLIRMIAICICESGLDPSSVNSTTSGLGVDRGIGKINSYFHPEVSMSCALDALCNLQNCYRISKGGTDFHEWVTYTNGCSDRNMTQVQNALGSTASTATKSVPHWCQPFMSQSQAWWEANGHHYPKDWAAAEGGVDWNPVPLDDTITALLPGKVVGSGYFCKPGQFCNLSWQQCNGIQGYGVVTIESINPYPDLVPGTLIHIYYQHIKIDGSIGLTCAGKSGQQVQAGQVIGTGNGSYNIEVGINVGSEWGRIWGGQAPGPHVDPIPFLYRLLSNGVPTNSLGVLSAIGATQGPVAAMYSGLMDTITTTSSQAKKFVTEIPGFLGTCEALDIIEQFIPFTLPAAALQDQATLANPGTYNLFGWDTGIPDPNSIAAKTQASIQLPSDSIQAILVFTVTNATAFLVRALFVTAGIILFYALMINLGSEIMNVQDTAQTVEKVAPLFM